MRVTQDRREVRDAFRAATGIFGLFGRKNREFADHVIGGQSGKDFPIPRPKDLPSNMAWPSAAIRRELPSISATIDIAEGRIPKKDRTGHEYTDDERKLLQEKAVKDLQALMDTLAREALMMKKNREANHKHFVDLSADPARVPLTARFSPFDPIKPDGELSWALLTSLDYNNQAAEVSNFGKNAARTLDGGEVLVDRHKIRVTKITPQSLTLLANEAAARGWPEMHVKIPHQHVAAMKAACVKAGIDAVITPTYRIGNNLPFMGWNMKGAEVPVHMNRHTGKYAAMLRDLEARAMNETEEPGPDKGPGNDKQHGASGPAAPVAAGPRQDHAHPMKDVTPKQAGLPDMSKPALADDMTRKMMAASRSNSLNRGLPAPDKTDKTNDADTGMSLGSP